MSDDIRRLFVAIIAIAGIVCSFWLFWKLENSKIEICEFENQLNENDIRNGTYVLFAANTSVCSSCALTLWEELCDYSDRVFLVVSERVADNVIPQIDSSLHRKVIICKKLNKDFGNKIIVVDKKGNIEYLADISTSYGQKNKVLKLHIGTFVR